jgi:hypothetical protein
MPLAPAPGPAAPVAAVPAALVPAVLAVPVAAVRAAPVRAAPAADSAVALVPAVPAVVVAAAGAGVAAGAVTVAVAAATEVAEAAAVRCAPSHPCRAHVSLPGDADGSRISDDTTRRGSGSADCRPWRRRRPPAHPGRSTILPGTPWPAACRFNDEGQPPLQPPRPRTHRHRAVSTRRSRGFAPRRGVRPLLPAAEAGSPRLAVSAGLHFARR